jgi:hypothetical protein
MKSAARLFEGGWIALFAVILGCNQAAGPTLSVENGKPTNPKDAATATIDKHHSHEGWWCDEHGVPEELCGQCDAKLAASFQRKGDWCKQHDRPDSQCFLCHPEYEARFAAQYAAKFGKKPPKPQG